VDFPLLHNREARNIQPLFSHRDLVQPEHESEQQNRERTEWQEQIGRIAKGDLVFAFRVLAARSVL
jgi:hypothetical protein